MLEEEPSRPLRHHRGSSLFLKSDIQKSEIMVLTSDSFHLKF